MADHYNQILPSLVLSFYFMFNSLETGDFHNKMLSPFVHVPVTNRSKGEHVFKMYNLWRHVFLVLRGQWYLSTYSNIQSHTGVLPVSKGLIVIIIDDKIIVS